MKKHLRHITIYLLAAMVFVATTGLSVHHLYCYCKGEMVTSIFRPDEPCEVAQKQSAKNCCKGTTCSATDGKEAHKCADCTSEYVKLDVKFLPTYFDLKLQEFLVPQVQFLPPSAIVVFEKNALRWEQDLPPPPAGKALLPWIQSYLC